MHVQALLLLLLSLLSPIPSAAQTEPVRPAEVDSQEEVRETPGRTTPEALVKQATEGSDLGSCWRDTRLRGARFDPVPGARPVGPPSLRRLVLAVDASGSMAGRAGGVPKMDAAKRAVASFLAGVPGDVEVGLVAFGRQGSSKPGDKPLSCQAGGETLFPIGGDRATIGAAVESLRPAGWTPLAAALRHAGTLMTATEVTGEQVIWVVSDGVETCGGDPVAAARAARRRH